MVLPTVVPQAVHGQPARTPCERRVTDPTPGARRPFLSRPGFHLDVFKVQSEMSAGLSQPSPLQARSHGGRTQPLLMGEADAAEKLGEARIRTDVVVRWPGS